MKQATKFRTLVVGDEETGGFEGPPTARGLTASGGVESGLGGKGRGCGIVVSGFAKTGRGVIGGGGLGSFVQFAAGVPLLTTGIAAAEGMAGVSTSMCGGTAGGV